MKARIISKPDLQAMLKALRAAGLTVTKLSAGYECKAPNGELLLKAMNGSGSYLVRMKADLFE